MGQINPYIANVSVTTDSTTVYYSHQIWTDYYATRYYSSLTNTWTSYIERGQNRENGYYFYNGDVYTINFQRDSTYSYFVTIHVRMYDWGRSYGGAYQYYFRSYQCFVYVPQKPGAKINHHKMFYKQFTGKDVTTNIYPTGTQLDNIIYQSNHTAYYTNATVGHIIDTTSKNWFQYSSDYIYRSAIGLQSPPYSNSNPWPW